MPYSTEISFRIRQWLNFMSLPPSLITGRSLFFNIIKEWYFSEKDMLFASEYLVKAWFLLTILS